jgi:hypothetical protein
MAAASLITITNASLELSLSSDTAGTAVDYQCQITTASLDPTANLNPVDATWCAPATQVPAPTSFTLNVTAYQDWGKTDSLSQFLFDHDTELADFTIDGLVVSDVGAVAAVATGQVRLVAGSYGGAAGAPLSFTTALPVQGKPTIAAGTAVTGAATRESETSAVG